MLLARRLEIWSDRQSAGGSRLAVIPDDLGAAEERSVTGEETLTLALPFQSDAAASLLERRVLRVDYADGVFDEWRITGCPERRTPAGELLIDVTAAPMLQDLGEECTVGRTEADGSVVYDFEALSLTPTQIVNTFILPALTAEGITDIALGTIDYALPVDVVFSWDTPLSALRKLAQVTGMELRLRRNGTTNYLIDLVAQIGSGANVPDVRFGKNLPWLTRTRTTEEAATRVQPRGAQDEFLYTTMAGARWKVTAIAGAGPFDVTLADPAGGDPPIGFDDQLNGLYLRRADGSLVVVADSTLSTQKIQIATLGAISVNDLVEFRKDSAGAALTFLENPAAKATYGRLLRILDRPDLPGTINLIANPAMRDYAGASAAPDGYTKLGNPTLTRTSAATRWRTGFFSCRIQGTADGDGFETPYSTLAPTSSLPYFSGYVAFWLEAGRVRVELIAAKATATITSITRSGQIATVTTPAPHGLTVGMLVEHTGITQAEYNGIFAVASVVSSTVYTVVVVGSPATPATGSPLFAQVWRLPNGTEGIAYSDKTKTWIELGPAGIDLNALAATRAKLRIVQDGSTAVDGYPDAFQLTQTAGQLEFLEGAGPTKLWQAANDYLQLHPPPTLRYACSWLDLYQLDPSTWAYEDLTLGGTVNVRDEALNITATIRVLGYRRSLRIPDLVELVLSNRAEDFTDQQLKPRLPRRKLVEAAVNVNLKASAAVIPVAASPGAVEVRLAANFPNATLYYWIGDEGAEPPPRTTVTAGAPTSTAWGTYAGVFQMDRDQSVDQILHAYARRGGERSDVERTPIDRNTTPSATMTLSEPVAGQLHIATSHDDDTVWLACYLADNGGGSGWPTTNTAIDGPLDPTKLVARVHVLADGGGVDKNGTAIAGGVIPDQAVAAAHVAKVILVPMDRDGNAGARVTATRTMAGAITPSLLTWSAVRSNNGTACDGTNGARYTFTWTVNAGVTDGSHDVEVVAEAAGDESTTLEVSPASVGSTTVRIPFYVTTGKSDPTIAISLSIRLKDSGGTILQEESCGGDSLKSVCAL